MSALSTGLVAGSNYSIYDEYYRQLDPNNKGSIGATDAAKFLKKSGLSDEILGKIWDTADSTGKGYLTKSGLFIALKLIALIQCGKEPTTNNLSIDVPPPKMGDMTVSSIGTSASSSPVPSLVNGNNSDWSIKPEEKLKYDRLFESLTPVNGLIPGVKVKGLLMESKLSVDILGKIWDLADIDKDGALNRGEFVVAMHLVHKAMEKKTIPNTLPPELATLAGGGAVFQSAILTPPLLSPVSIPSPLLAVHTPPPLMPITPVVTTASTVLPYAPRAPQPKSAVPNTTLLENFACFDEPKWVIDKQEKVMYDQLFAKADLDQDGYVSGHEIKDVFLKSGVAQSVLAHVWNLCDTEEQGKLNDEQFALALWLISRKLRGIEVPPTLPPEMVPPSCRKKTVVTKSSTNETAPLTSPEVDKLSKEVEELLKEKSALEIDISQQESDIKIKKLEVSSLQGDLDKLVTMLKQLENQKSEAVKRINDLKAQSNEFEIQVSEARAETELQEIEVEKLRKQAEELGNTLKNQEAEVNKKKQELEDMKKEEIKLNKRLDDLKKELEVTSKATEETNTFADEIKSKLSELEEMKIYLKTAMSNFNSILDNKNIALLSEVYLKIEPTFRNDTYTTILDNELKKYCNPDPFTNVNDTTFSNSAAFEHDPFENPGNMKSDPFGANDPFNSSAGSKIDGFSTDPFASFETTETNKPDPFEAFGSATSNKTKSTDGFDYDPFAILHAPTKERQSGGSGGAESPSPALPPKKSKQPPPRPAPPRPAPPASTTVDDFADFARFPSKVTKGGSSSKWEAWSATDPFRDYRYADPFEAVEEEARRRAPSAPTAAAVAAADAFDPFVVPAAGRRSAPPFNGLVLPPSLGEEQQLEWARAESVKAEKERRKRAEKEKAEIKLALKLSKADTKKRSFRSKLHT